MNLSSYGIKSTLAQIMALMATYVFTLKVGIDMMTPTIIIGAIADRRLITEQNVLSDISEEQITWIGSLVYLFPPVGGAVLSVAQDRFGHRACMVFANGAQLLSVIALHNAGGPAGLYLSCALMGFNVGYATGFTVSYCGEVCEPRLRGALTSVTNLFYFGGYLCVTVLFAVTADWRLSVIATVVVPVLNAVLLHQTPDSPMWLLSKGEVDKAKSTLQRLRGGASDEKCDAEFQDMVRYASEMSFDGHEKEETAQHQSNAIKDSLYRCTEPETLKPLILLMVLIFFTNILSGIPYTPYLLSVFEKFKVPLDPAWATTICMGAGVVGNVLNVFLINRVGKRFLALGTMATCSICYLSIGFVGHFWPSSCLVSSWMKIVMFFVSTFFSSMGVMPIMWILMGELFPMKSKNIGAGISSTAYFVLCFLMTKFYLDLEAATGFYNTFILFGTLGLVGLTYMYFQLPETENKTLSEISEHFRSKCTKTKYLHDKGTLENNKRSFKSSPFLKFIFRLGIAFSLHVEIMQKKEGMEFSYGLKSTLAQCLVLTTTYFLNAQQGINIAMPMTIIGAFQKSNSDQSYDTQIKLTEEQLSWIGSLVYLSPPLGSLFLSLVLARLGHRVCMALTNLVQFSSVLIVVLFPVTVNTLYMCSILMGLSTGCATGLCISYSGEVCEPKLRGSLTSALNVFYFAGTFFVSTAYAITDSWKKSLICSIMFPLINVVALSMTPDSPMWLLSRGKPEKARKVLRKIRGCVSEEKCALEFQEIIQYVSKSTKSEEAKQASSFRDRFSHPELWKPLKLAVIYLFFSNVLSGVPYSQYLLKVTGTIKDDTPITAEWAVSMYTACSVAGNIFTILLVNFLGKRCLLLSTIGICSLSFLLIGVIGLFFSVSYYASWAKLILFFLTMISSSMGIMPIGWILISEIFPMKSKNLGCSICSAVYFLLCFAMTKYYEDFEALVGFYNMFVWFGVTGFVSLVYFYFCVPETENKTLKEIAEQFRLESA